MDRLTAGFLRFKSGEFACSRSGATPAIAHPSKLGGMVDRRVQLQGQVQPSGHCRPAVVDVCGHTRGLTETLPLHVEAVYNEYDFVGAFSCASLPAGPAIVTLVPKTILEQAGHAAVKKGSAA
jgi:hypothetical protein